MPSFEAAELQDDAAMDAATLLLMGQRKATSPTSMNAAGEDRARGAAASDRDSMAAFEVVAAALALGGSRAAPLLQGRYAYWGQPAVADCAEMVTRELVRKRTGISKGRRLFNSCYADT